MSLFEESQPPSYTKEGAGMPAIVFIGFKFVENFDEGGVWISTNTVFNPRDFPSCMSIRGVVFLVYVIYLLVTL